MVFIEKVESQPGSVPVREAPDDVAIESKGLLSLKRSYDRSARYEENRERLMLWPRKRPNRDAEIS